MGASQSSAISQLAEDSKRILPYGVGQTQKHIQLNSSYSTLYDGIVSLVQENKYADLIIICGDDRYPVHRAVVCPRSHFFEECCVTLAGETDNASPGRPIRIWIDPFECESHVLAAVLTFLYTLDYSASGAQSLTFGLPQDGALDDDADKPSLHSIATSDLEGNASLLGDDSVGSATTVSQETPERTSDGSSTITNRDPSDITNELAFHAQVCLASQRFGITSLYDVSKDKFEKRLRSGPWNKEMIPCIREIYRHGNTSKLGSLKDHIVKSARSRFRALKACEGWEELVLDFPEFAAELLRRM